MNKLWLSFVLIILTLHMYGQVKVSGTVKSSVDDKTMYDVTVRLLENGQSVQTDRIGYYQFTEVPDGSYTLQIDKLGFTPYEETLQVKGENIELGDIFLSYDPRSINMGVITLTSDELSSDESSAQSSVGLLQSSKDVFARTAAFELGAFWFRTRGYDNKYTDVLLNGVQMNKIDDGRVDFGNWGGLNDITRYPAEVTYGLDPSDYAFGDLGGVTYFDTRPSILRTGTSLAYSSSNRSYRQRVMATHNTGLNSKGWGFTVSGSRRWAEEGRIPGTFYDAWAYFLGIEKKVNDKHSLNLTIMGAPYRRSTNSPNTQEIFDIKGTDYNAYWGYQDGEKRNERVKDNHEPIAQLTHHWDINQGTKLISTVSYQTGYNNYSRLDWDNAPSPSPIYYRNMPSYILSRGGSLEAYNDRIEDWKNGTISQIKWDELYNFNANSSSGRAAYYIVNDVNDDTTFNFSTNLRKEFSESVSIYTGMNYQNTKSELYREIKDIMGGQYVLDVDDFAEIGESGFADENNPNFKAKEGDRVQYSYDINQTNFNAFLNTNYKKNNWDVTLALKAGNTSFKRTGNFDHYKYDNSYGDGEEFDFTDIGAKLNLTYKLDGRNFLTTNLSYMTDAPTYRDVMPNGRETNTSIPNPELAKITSGDINYYKRSANLKLRATAFYTLIKDDMESSFGYIEGGNIENTEDPNIFTGQVLQGVDKKHMGVELAMEAKLTTRFTASAVASIGQYTYDNNDSDLYYFSRQHASQGGYNYMGKAYLKDYKLSVSPQQGYSVGVQYRDPNYWWLGITGNYLANNYIDINPSKRITKFLQDNIGQPVIGVTDELLRDYLKQEKAENAFMLNLNAGKTFRFGDYYMGISASVNNVLNNKDYITGGFEQLRIGNYSLATDENRNKTFGNKYWYDQGLTYFLNVFLRF